MKNSVRFRRGQIVRDPGSEGVADVEVRIATVYVRIVDETRRVEVVGKRIGRRDIDRVGPCIRSQSLQAFRQTAIEFELQGVVIRGRRIAGYVDKLKIRIGIEEIGNPQQV